MFLQIRKRDDRIEPFNPTKITEAIFAAAKAVGGEDRQTAMELTIEVMNYLKKQKQLDDVPGVEEVQDAVEKVLIETGHARTAKAYILYREKRSRLREGRTELMDTVAEIVRETNRDNANVGNSPSAKILQIAEAASKSFYLRRLIPEDESRAHLEGDIYIHDLGWYGKTMTCLQIRWTGFCGKVLTMATVTSGRRRASRRRRLWRPSFCRATRMICTVASLLPILTGI